MNTSAIVVMVLGCGALWGGLGIFVSIAIKKAKKD